MRIALESEPNEPPFDYSKNNLEAQFCDALISATEFFHESVLRCGDDGFYFKYAGKIFRFQLDVKLECEVPSSPIPFDRQEEKDDGIE